MKHILIIESTTDGADWYYYEKLEDIFDEKVREAVEYALNMAKGSRATMHGIVLDYGSYNDNVYMFGPGYIFEMDKEVSFPFIVEHVINYFHE